MIKLIFSQRIIHLMSTITSNDSEGKLVSMIMEATKYVRFAAVCDVDGQILWNSHRNNVDNILTLEETKDSLKRACETWKVRDELSAKIGNGKYAIVAYDKIKRITVPLQNNHMLFLSVEGEKPGWVGDVMKIVSYVQKNLP